MIRQADLRKDWPWIKPLVEQVKLKHGYDWYVEDVYAAVSSGKAAMFVSDEPEGVLVCQPEKSAWTGEPVLFVWLVHCIDGMERMQDEVYALLDKMKQNIGATRIVMEGRPGWQKCGWRVKTIIFER